MAIDRTKKVSEFARISRAGTDDLLLLVNDPNGTPSTRTITIKNLYNDVGAEAVFYANTTFKANSHFQSNTLYTGNDNRFNSNVHFTSNLTISNTSSIEAYGRTYSGSNPPIGNAEFQAFVANTNLFIQTLQADGTFLLPNGAFAVANTTYNTDLANTNSRLQGLEAYGQLASNSHVINTYVANTTYQSFAANSTTNLDDSLARVATLETKVANQESLTANGFNVAFANAVATASAQSAVFVSENYIPLGNSAARLYDDSIDASYIGILNHKVSSTWDAVNHGDVAPQSNGYAVALESGLWVPKPSPSLGFTVDDYQVDANAALGFFFDSGPGVVGSVNETIYAYKGFTYTFYPAWLTQDRNILIVNDPNDISSVFANGVYTANTGRAYANGLGVTARTELTIPMAQEANLYYMDSANSATYGTIVIR
jgi:hypothetical protein